MSLEVISKYKGNMSRVKWTAALEGAMLKIWLQLTAATDPNPSRRRAAATARKLTRTGREAPITSAAHSKD